MNNITNLTDLAYNDGGQTNGNTVNYVSTTSSGTSNSLNGGTYGISNCATYPYIGYSTYYTPVEPSFKIKVEAVENGFIIHKDGKKFIETKAENIVKYLKD